MLDGGHAGRRVVGAGERDAAEPGAQLLQPLPELGEKMGAARVLVLEGQSQAFDRRVAFGFRQLLPRLLEHFVLPRGVAEQPAGPEVRLAARHPVSPRPCGGP